MRRPARLAAVLLVIAAGCGSFSSSGDPTPADAGADGVAPVEAGPPVPDGAPPDGAASDAGSGFCNVEGPKHNFCADFDTVANVTDGWTAEVLGPADPPAFANIASSPPRSMRSAVRRAPDAGANVPISALVYDAPFPTPMTGLPELRVQFALFVEKADDAPRNAAIVGIELDELVRLFLIKTSDAECRVSLTQGNTEYTLSGLSVPVGKWTRVGITVAARPGPPPSTGLITVTVGTDTVNVTPDVVGYKNLFRTGVGLAFANPAGGDWTAYFDDVLIDGAKRTK